MKTRMAILDFEFVGNKNSTNNLETMVAEWLVTALVKDGRFDVIERAMLQKILMEQQLGATGSIDPSSASKIGKILGVKIVVTGSVFNLGERIEVNARIINVEDGTITAAENITCPSPAELQKSVEQLTVKIVKHFPLSGYVVKKDKDVVLIDVGKGAGVQMGMEFVVYKEGKTITHPKTGEILDVEQLNTGRIKVTKIEGQVAEAAILQEEKGDGIEYGQLVHSIPSQQPEPVKKQVIDKTQIVDSPVILETDKPARAETRGESRNDPGGKARTVDRTPARPAPEPKKQVMAPTPHCQELLKSWQLGDSSDMQRYVKECAQ